MAPQFEIREFFHLAFLRLLAQRLTGRPYALKGGICLRCFHRSPRLSEDMDFDVRAQIAVMTLQKTVDTILASRALRAILMPMGLTDLEATRPRQTDTVQRWKIGLRVGESRLATKLEFGRRPQQIAYAVGIPDADLLHRYYQSPFAVQHYGREAMVTQKILALASPSRTALRDLFDLHHLLVFLKTNVRAITAALPRAAVNAAHEKIARFSAQAFAEQVLPYLTAECIAGYSDHRAFDHMRAETLAYLHAKSP